MRKAVDQAQSLYDILIEPFNRGELDLFSYFKDESALYYDRALSALDDLFDTYLKSSSDVVTIFTSSASCYISSCVTGSIEKKGKWSRVFEERTKIALVIHEWGLIYPHLDTLKKRCSQNGIILVEDSAYATGSYFHRRSGTSGDFTVFSLKKFFGTPLGGILIPRLDFMGRKGKIFKAGMAHVTAPIEIEEKRREVWRWYEDELGPAIKSETAKLWVSAAGDVPSVFLYPEGSEPLRDFLRAHRVECGYWYGNRHLFLPCHQEISRDQVKHICRLLRSFSAIAGDELPAALGAVPAKTSFTIPADLD